MNSVFNTNCGTNTVGDDTIFGHHCLVMTGTHRFYEGKRASLSGVPFDIFPETPSLGRDINIGKGCFIGAGTILIRPLNIGDHSVVSAGSVVTKDCPPHSVLAGIPAKIIRSTFDL
jgi:acetyltransferase-like isoleucine patch superfamily enzyme